MDVYINSTGHFLPGEPVSNDQMEDVLGLIDGKKSRLKNKILKSNGIKQRHYAINDNQQTEISNSEMAANAGQSCIENSYVSPNQIQMLSCATSQGDLVLPGFGSMVQAQLNLSEIELHTSHGICSSSMMALKAAYTNIKCDDVDNALVVASELTSRLFKNKRYEQVENNEVDFNAEFLRWMLSDGAGAVLLENKPRPTGKSLRIDWIKSFSFADVYPVCMSVGMEKNEQADKTWQDYETYADAEKAGALLLRQDVRLLDNIVSVGVQGFLKLIAQGRVKTDNIDHVLCHFSSKYFKSKIFEMLETAGASVPDEKWYTNLYERGNTGCASIFIMLDEFLKTHDVKPGETIFCMVPESGRFNVAYMHLTVEG
ncbi:beta-ketoacyl-ACP synthase III [Thalassotalea crassostreae]|uniref:beta-ketoacyl-ACP synthase III n=1 Tax=Thalassotalea crassostreae TaxID=1763536 RepID=UPI0008392399|nr:beta-ketoacyl-ACP synthase III [Thalassotalea crassostreae]